MGIWLVARTPRLWPLCLGPLIAALTTYVLLGAALGFWAVPRIAGWFGLERGSGVWWAAEIGFVLVWLVLFSFLFVLLVGIFAGLIFDRLSRAVEALTGGVSPPDTPLGWTRAVGDSLQRLLLSGTLGIAALVLSLFLGPSPGVLAAAVIGLLDFTAPAYLRRGLTLGPQSGRLLGKPDGATFGFALISGLLSLLPLVGVLLLPGLVAGGTLLVRRKEERE